MMKSRIKSMRQWENGRRRRKSRGGRRAIRGGKTDKARGESVEQRERAGKGETGRSGKAIIKITTLFRCRIYLIGDTCPSNHSKVDIDLSHDRHTHINTQICLPGPTV